MFLALPLINTYVLMYDICTDVRKQEGRKTYPGVYARTHPRILLARKTEDASTLETFVLLWYTIGMELEEHLFAEFVKLPAEKRSISLLCANHNNSTQDYDSQCSSYSFVEVPQVLEMAAAGRWLQGIASDSSAAELMQLERQVDFYAAYESDVTNTTQLLDRIYSYYLNTPVEEIQQPHQLIRILSDVRRKAIEASLGQETESTLEFVVDEDSA